MDIDRRASVIGPLEQSVPYGGFRDGGSRRCIPLRPQTIKRPEEEERQETVVEEKAHHLKVSNHHDYS